MGSVKLSIQTNTLKNQVLAFYCHSGFKTALYARIRSASIPFCEIEAQIPKEARCLDVGCGVGFVSNLLEIGSDKRIVLGIDIDGNRIKIAQQTLGKRKNIDFICGNIFNLNLQQFDVIIIVDVLHHLKPKLQQETIKKCVSLLSPKGFILIKDVGDRPRWKYWYNFFVDNFTRFLQITKGDKCHYLCSLEFKNLLQNNGLQADEIKIIHKDFAPHILIKGSKV